MRTTRNTGFRSRLGRAVLALVMVCAAAGALPAQSVRRLTLAIGYIPHIQFAPLYVGIEKGFYREAGIELKIEYGFGVDIFSLLSMGRVDIGLSDSDQLILAGEKGLGLKAIFQYYRTYPVTIVTNRPEIRTPADFAGRAIGTPELYGTSYIGLRLFLKEHGLDRSVEVERIGYTQVPSLLSGKVDGAVCFFNNEPVVFAAQGIDVRSWDVRDFSRMVGASFITSDRILDSKEELLERFTEATARAMEYTVRNPAEAVEISKRAIGNVDAAQAALLPEILGRTIRLFEGSERYGSLDAAAYRTSIRELQELGLISKVFPEENILHSFE